MDRGECGDMHGKGNARGRRKTGRQRRRHWTEEKGKSGAQAPRVQLLLFLSLSSRAPSRWTQARRGLLLLCPTNQKRRSSPSSSPRGGVETHRLERREGGAEPGTRSPMIPADRRAGCCAYNHRKEGSGGAVWAGLWWVVRSCCSARTVYTGRASKDLHVQ